MINNKMWIGAVMSGLMFSSCSSSKMDVVGARNVEMKTLSKSEARKYARNDRSRNSQLEAGIESSVNSSRLAKGGNSIKHYPELADLARDHSRDLMQEYTRTGVPRINHDGYNKRFNKMILKFAFQKAGENVAFLPNNSGGAKEIVRMWINSPSHNKNLFDNWNRTGVGVAIAPDGMIFATQLYCLKTDFTF